MNWILKIILFCFGVLFICVAATIFYLSPAFKPFPKLTGSYLVGIKTFSFTDLERHEIHSQDPLKRRELVVDIFYPSYVETTAERPAKDGTVKQDQLYPFQPERVDATIKFHAKRSWLPEFVWKLFFRNLQSYANPNAQISEQKSFPVVIFSHGIGSEAFYNLYLEDLASHGYVVASVYHPYDTNVVVFPDGRIIELDPNFARLVRHTYRAAIYDYRAEAHKVWLKDQQFVISKLAEFNTDANSMFYQKLDLDHIGAMGHSHGGAAVIDLVKLDERVKAGIDLDGWTKTANGVQGFGKPFMILEAQCGYQPGLAELYKNMGHAAYDFKIPGATHISFTDFILLKWPLSRFYDVMHGNQEYIEKDIRALIHSFFDQYLKNESNVLIEAAIGFLGEDFAFLKNRSKK